MGDLARAALLLLLLATGAVAFILSAGLALVHRLVDRHPALDAQGWLLATYGCTALAAYDVLAGETSPVSVAWIVAAAFAGYMTGRRTCGQWIAIPSHPEEGP